MASYGTLRSIQSLGIVYSCVSRGSTILALYASCQGNFSEVVPQVLSAIPVEEYGRCTYTSGDYMFHYVTDEGIIFLCITDDDFERSRAFLFLEEIKKKLFNGFGIEKLRYSSAYSLNTFFKEELKSQMETYSEDSYTSPYHSNEIRLDTIKVKTFDALSQSGVELEQLELMESGDNFSVRSIEAHIAGERRRRCKHICKKYSYFFILLAVLIGFIFIILIALIIIVIVDENDIKHSNNS